MYLDGAVPVAKNSHFIGISFAYGGLAGDKPIADKRQVSTLK